MGCTVACANLRRPAAAGQKPVSLSTLLQSYGYIAVPLTRDESGLYTLQGEVDSTSVTLALDCGFSGNIFLNRSIADPLGIRGAPDRVWVGAGGTSATDTTHMNRFAIKTLHLDSQFVKIVPRFLIADGGLGASFASAHGAIMDYTNDVLYVRGSLRHDFTLLPGSEEHQGDVAVPLTRVTRGDPARVVYVLKAAVDSILVTLLLDTGAARGFIVDQHRADEIGLHATSTEVVEGVGGEQLLHAGRVGRLTLGTIHMDSLQFASIDMSPMIQRFHSDSLPHIDGILGASVLRNRGAIIDFDHGVLYLHSK